MHTAHPAGHHQNLFLSRLDGHDHLRQPQGPVAAVCPTLKGLEGRHGGRICIELTRIQRTLQISSRRGLLSAQAMAGNIAGHLATYAAKQAPECTLREGHTAILHLEEEKMHTAAPREAMLKW